MDFHTLEHAREIAEEVVRQAGCIAKEKFNTIVEVSIKDSFGDVLTEVDLLAEQLIVSKINQAFPSHQIHSEEAGLLGEESDWLWLVDPLDGTNNFAIGLSVFTISVTLLHKKVPILGVIYEPMTDRMFSAIKGKGSCCNNKPIQCRFNGEMKKANIGWIQGHRVQHDPLAVKLRQHIDLSCKRMLRLWAPTLQWCLLAKGDIDAIVLFNSEGDDLYSGLIIAKEAGCIVLDFDGKPFEGMCDEPYLIACHPEFKESLLSLIKKGYDN